MEKIINYENLRNFAVDRVEKEKIPSGASARNFDFSSSIILSSSFVSS